MQAPLQPVGEASLKKEGKESKEPQEPQEPKEYGIPPSESQATEAKTAAETKDAGGSSTLHSGGTTNGGDQSGKEAEPEAEMPSMAADECPDLGLEMASSGELGHATPLTGDAESEDRLAIARDTRTEEAVFWKFLWMMSTVGPEMSGEGLDMSLNIVAFLGKVGKEPSSLHCSC